MNLSDKRRVSLNVLTTVIQVIVTGIVFIVFYRYLLDRLGIEQLGVWSIVLATASVSRIGDFGLSVGVVRFVAQALAKEDRLGAAEIVETVAITIGLLMAVMLTAGFPLFKSVLEYLLFGQERMTALEILPYALLSFWGMMIAGVFLAGLDGCQRIDLRSGLMALSNIFFLILTLLWVPHFGLKGAAFAQVAQSLGLAFVSWWTLRRQVADLALFPIRWRLPVLKQMIGYGVSSQVISIMSVLFDSITKGLMSKFGGLGSLGYYEMANKLLIQSRAIIVEANRVIIPMVSTLKDRQPEKIVNIFALSYRSLFYVAVLFYMCVAISLPSISVLWIGSYQSIFVQFALLLTFGWFVNTLAVPAFFLNYGTGELRQNVITQSIIGLGGFGAGMILGFLINGIGVVLGSVFGLTVGSVFLIVFHMKKSGMCWSEVIIPRDMWQLLAIGSVAVWLSVYGSYVYRSRAVVLTIGVTCVVGIMMLGWIHSMRKELFRLMQDSLTAVPTL